MDAPRTRRTLFLFAALAVLVAGLVQLAAMDRGGAGTPGLARLTIDGPDGARLHVANVSVPGGTFSVLDHLREEAGLSGFTVETRDYAGMGAMVVQIFSYRNDGPCGWVYEVNGASGTRSAEYETVTAGDEVRWSWACHS